MIKNLFDAICIFLLRQTQPIRSSKIVSKNKKIYLQILFDPSLGRKSVSHTGKHTVDVPKPSVRQQSLTILEDFFYGMSGLHYRTLVTLMPLALLCFMVMEKLWPLCCCLQEVYTFFFIIRKKIKWCQLNLSASVNHTNVTGLREVYSDLGWLPLGVMTQRVSRVLGLNLVLMVVKGLLSCNIVPKIACACKILRTWMLYYYQNNVNEL